ncbi:MAG: winged helix-turn-helix transcriptional regulator [Candidatus Thorarchaeota archaeon]|jgi:DNA-binding Lrp family transcriptional regulator
MLDKALIGELSNSCRMSFSHLAEKYSVSVNTIKNRVEQLLEDRVILGFDVTPKMSLFNASFASIMLHLEDRATREVIDELGSSEFIMAVMTGFEPEGFAIAIYRNTDELNQAVEHLRTNSAVREVEVIQLLPPPSSKEALKSSKTLDLYHLRWNGRMPLNEIAEKTGKSVPTIRKRIEFMRKHDLIYESTIVNIGAVGTGMVITLVVEMPDLSSSKQLEIDELFRETYPEEFWLSWMSADRPVMLLSFYTTSAKAAGDIRNNLENIVPSLQVVGQIVSGEWEYFRDFRDGILKEESGEIS